MEPVGRAEALLLIDDRLENLGEVRGRSQDFKAMTPDPRDNQKVIHETLQAMSSALHTR